MIKIGDRVKFLNDVGGGIVTGFIGKNMVKVENEDGFEVPCPVSQLINVDDPALNRGEPVAATPAAEVVRTEKPEKKEGKIIAGKDAPGFYFCFVPEQPDNPLEGNIDLVLVNDSNYTVQYHFSHFRGGQYKTMGHGSVPPNSDTDLEQIGMDEWNDLPEYCFQLVYFREEDKEWHPAVRKKFRINPVKLYKAKSFQSNAFFEEPAMVYQISEDILNTEIDKLTEDDFRKVVKAKEKSQEKATPPPKKETDTVEIDLHIHELVENTSGLSNKEILEVQMEKVEREMRSAIDARARRIVFIHGVGQGVLKQEIARMLKRKFPRYTFQDASFREYGYGATMVLLRRK